MVAIVLADYSGRRRTGRCGELAAYGKIVESDKELLHARLFVALDDGKMPGACSQNQSFLDVSKVRSV